MRLDSGDDTVYLVGSIASSSDRAAKGLHLPCNHHHLLIPHSITDPEHPKGKPVAIPLHVRVRCSRPSYLHRVTHLEYTSSTMPGHSAGIHPCPSQAGDERKDPSLQRTRQRRPINMKSVGESLRATADNKRPQTTMCDCVQRLTGGSIHFQSSTDHVDNFPYRPYIPIP